MSLFSCCTSPLRPPVLQTVEEFDQSRLDRMRRDMWVYSNMGSIAAVVDDNANEELRAALEKVDPEKDMQTFVSQSATGSVHPGIAFLFCFYLRKKRTKTLVGLAVYL